jgi:esterase/lipase
LISNKGKKVIKIHFGSHDKRLLMRNALSCLKYIEPFLLRVIKNINKNNIEVIMVFGKFDFIIPVKLGIRFMKKIKSKKQMYVIDGSHNILIDKNASFIAEKVLQ